MEDSVRDLQLLANLYHINPVELLKRAGFITERNFAVYDCVFEHTELLTDEQRDLIQKNINQFVKQEGLT